MINTVPRVDAPNLTIIAKGLAFPEGPVWLPDGRLLVCEIARGTIREIDLDGTPRVLVATGGGPNGLAVGPDDRFYICNNGGLSWLEREDRWHPSTVLDPSDYSGGRIERFDPRSGTLDVLYSKTEQGPLNGPNDIVFDDAGGFWFTDLGKYRETTLDRGAVYYALADGSHIERVIFPMLTPNGVGLSPDGRTLHVAESQTARLWAFDIVGPGRIASNDSLMHHGGRLIIGLPGYQIFDSLAVEADGRICVGTLASGGITTVTPDGQEAEFMKLPDAFPTNLCFGGKDMRTAFVTLSETGRLISLRWPREGLRLPGAGPLGG